MDLWQNFFAPPCSHLQMYFCASSDSNMIMYSRRLCEQHANCLTPDPSPQGAPFSLSLIPMEPTGAAVPAKSLQPPCCLPAGTSHPPATPSSTCWHSAAVANIFRADRAGKEKRGVFVCRVCACVQFVLQSYVLMIYISSNTKCVLNVNNLLLRDETERSAQRNRYPWQHLVSGITSQKLWAVHTTRLGLPTLQSYPWTGQSAPHASSRSHQITETWCIV